MKVLNLTKSVIDTFLRQTRESGGDTIIKILRSPDPTSFSNYPITFKKNVDLYKAVFLCKAQYDGAIFNSNAYYVKSKFYKEANFDNNVRFKSGVAFVGAKFYSMANFM